MNREEMTMLGFEIVAYAGDARSKLLEALTKAESGEYDEAEALVEAANQCIIEAHKSQTTLLTKEANGEDLELSFTMVHGQDHLMTTMLLKDMMKHMIELYKRGTN
ncbi:PTS lactose/cellobiose transporter subunit IIA [Streptococcus pluranimalium]|uniref:PTS lactose/cellobiose transporter subunit IIA n=1 Tax=Streptococcus pluranimalium TaxID=82348 RepID=UPI0039FBCF7F